MVTESEDKGVRCCLVQSVDADVVVGVCRVVDGKDVREGLRGIRWELVGHLYCRWREMVICDGIRDASYTASSRRTLAKASYHPGQSAQHPTSG